MTLASLWFWSFPDCRGSQPFLFNSSFVAGDAFQIQSPSNGARDFTSGGR
jgi:hypothetical protein